MTKKQEFEEFTTAKSWELDKNKFFIDATPEEIWQWMQKKDKQQIDEIIKIIEERINYGKKYRLNKKEDLRSGWTGIESGECCDKCKMRDEDFNGSADALKAIVGCRNPFQLKKTCECHLPFRKVAEESIQQALQLIKEKICNNGTPNK